MNWNIRDSEPDTNSSKGGGSSKRGPGRPRSSDMVHATVRVPREVYERLREWGAGNISAGVRVAVERALGAGKDKGEGEG